MSEIVETQQRVETVQPTTLRESVADMRERKDLLLCMYQENCNRARHYETTRASVVAFTLAAAVAIAALIPEHGLNIEDRRLAFVLIVIGIFGAIFTGYYFKRIDFFEHRAIEFFAELDRLFGTNARPEPPKSITTIHDTAKTSFDEKFCWNGVRSRKLRIGDLFRMYWPIAITLLTILLMQLKFGFRWLGWDQS